MPLRPRALVATLLSAALLATALPAAAAADVPYADIFRGGACDWVRPGETTTVQVFFGTSVGSPAYDAVTLLPVVPAGWAADVVTPPAPVVPSGVVLYTVRVTAPADAAPGVSPALRFDAVDGATLLASETLTLSVVDAPAAPAGVVATPGDAVATVSWTPGPAHGPAGAERRYVVTAEPGGARATVTGTTTATVAGLANGTPYTFTVSEWNPWGETASAPSAPVVPAGPPAPVTGVAVTGSGATRTVSWAAPDPNGSPLTGYTVTAEPGGATTHVPAGPTTAEVTGLDPATEYAFRVHATNAVGDGPASALPGEPAPFTGTVTVAEAGEGALLVTVSDPEAAGVAGWQVEVEPSGRAEDVMNENGGRTGYAYVVADGTTAAVRVRPFGNGVVGPRSAPLATGTSFGTPPPIALSAPVERDGALEVCFPGAWGGGGAVTGYVVAADGGPTWRLPAGDRRGVLTGLTNWWSYRLSVAADTAHAGYPRPHTDHDVYATPRGAPGAATGVTTRRGDGTASVSFDTVPEADSYEAVAQPGGTVVRGTHSTLGFSGLANGTAYTFTVRARNEAGAGPAVTAGPVTPAGVPYPVTGLTATALGGRRFHVAWDPADGNGSPVTSYDVFGASSATLVAQTETSRTYDHASWDTEYEISVLASNAVGRGAGAKTTVRTPAYDVTAPSVSVTAPAPVTMTGAAGVSYAATDAASYDVRYRVARWDGDFGAYRYPAAWQGTTATGSSVATRPGWTYCFAVRARDAAGNTSGWTADSCTAAPLDDRSLTASRGWARSTSTRYLHGTYTATVTRGSTLTLGSVRSARLALVVTRCAACGTVGVYVNGVLTARVSTAAKTAAYRVVLTLGDAARTGRVTLKALSGRVYVDGLAAARS